LQRDGEKEMKTLIFDDDHRLHWISAQEIYSDALQIEQVHDSRMTAAGDGSAI